MFGHFETLRMKGLRFYFHLLIYLLNLFDLFNLVYVFLLMSSKLPKLDWHHFWRIIDNLTYECFTTVMKMVVCIA